MIPLEKRLRRAFVYVEDVSDQQVYKVCVPRWNENIIFTLKKSKIPVDLHSQICKGSSLSFHQYRS